MLFYDLQSNGNPETRFFLHQKTKCFKCKAIIILRWIPVKRRQDYLFKRKFLFKKARKGNAKSFVGTCPLSLTDTCTFWMLRTPVLLYEKKNIFHKMQLSKKVFFVIHFGVFVQTYGGKICVRFNPLHKFLVKTSN